MIPNVLDSFRRQITVIGFGRRARMVEHTSPRETSIPSLERAIVAFKKALSFVLGKDMSSLEVHYPSIISDDRAGEDDRTFPLSAILPDGRKVEGRCKASRKSGAAAWDYFMIRLTFSDGTERGVRIYPDATGQERVESLSDDSKGGRPVPRDVWDAAGRDAFNRFRRSGVRSIVN